MKKFLLLLISFWLVHNYFLQAQTTPIWALNSVNNLTTGGNVTPRAVKVNTAGGANDIYVLGHFTIGADFDPGPGVFSPTVTQPGLRIFLAKYNSLGQFQWCNVVGNVANSNYEGYGLEVDNSGVYITGYFTATGDFDPGAGIANLQPGAYVVKYTHSGAYSWGFSIQGVGNYGLGLAVEPNQNFIYVTGEFTGSNISFGTGVTLSSNGSSDIFLAKYSTSNGAISWARRFGSANADGARAVKTDASGNVYIGGYFSGTTQFDPANVATAISTAGSGQGNREIFVAKYNSSGNYLWAFGFGSTFYNDEVFGLDLDASANVYITGYFVNTVDFDPGAGVANIGFGSTNGEIFLAKYTTNGAYVWAKAMGGVGNDGAYGIAVDGSGNSYITGSFTTTVDFDPGPAAVTLSSSSVTDRDMFLAKYDASGNYSWAKRFGSTTNDDGYAVTLFGNNSPIMTGAFTNIIDYDPDAGVATFYAPSTFTNGIFGNYSAATGAYVSAFQLGTFYTGITAYNEEGYRTVTDASGNVYVAGTFQGIVDFDPSAGTHCLVTVNGTNNFTDNYIAKYSPTGAFLGAISFGGVNDDAINDMKIDADGNLIVCGNFTGTIDVDPTIGITNLVSNGNSEIYFAKFSPSLNLIWAKSIGGASLDIVRGLAVDASNNIYLTGAFTGTVDFDPNAGVQNLVGAANLNVFLAKYNTNGNWVWASNIGGTSNEIAYSVALEGTSVVITGEFAGTANFDPIGTANLTAIGTNDIFVAKYRQSNGSYLWAFNLGAANTNNRGVSIAAKSGSIYLLGQFRNTLDVDPSPGVAQYTSNGGQDLFVAWYNGGGVYQSSYRLGGDGDDVAGSIKLNNNGTEVYFCGSFSGTADFDLGPGVNNITSTGSVNYPQDAFFYKLNDVFTPLEFKVFGSNQLDRCNDIATNAAGDLYATGVFGAGNFITNTTINFNLGSTPPLNVTGVNGFDLFLAKYGSCTQPTTPTISGTTSICSGQSTTLSVASGTLGSASNWVWFTGSCGGTQIGTGTSITVSPTGNTTYWVRAQGGCVTPSACASVSVTVNPLPSAGTLSGTQTLCAGATTTFSSTVSGGSWSSSNTSIATVNASTGVVTGVAAGTADITYTVTGTGGCNATATRQVTVNAAPNPAISPQSSTICAGNSVTLTASGGINYTWNQALGSGATKVITPGGNSPITWSYTVTVTASNGCSASATATISVLDTPAAPITPLNPIICNGGSVTLSASGGTSYNWSNGLGSNASVTVSPTTTTTYSVFVAGANGCDGVLSRTVTVGTNPTAAINPPSSAVCSGQSVTLTASGGTGYTWSNGGGSNAQANFSPTVNTTYTVTVSNASGCTATASATVSVTNPPSAGTLSGNQNVCAGSTTTFSSTSTGGTWSSSNTAIATVNASTGVVTGVAAGTATITYTVTGTGGCANAAATRTVTVTAAPSAGTLSGNQNVCVGSTTTFSSTVSGGSWSSSNTAVATVNATTGVVTGVAAGTATITYTVTGTGGCADATATRTVTVTAAPSVGTLSGNQNVCAGSTTTFSSTVSGGSWSSSNTAIATVNASTGVVTGVAAGTATITYTVTGTGGCANATATRTVTVTAAPSAGTLSGNQNVCAGSTTTFSSTVSGGTWSSSNIAIATVNASTGVVTGVAAGTATITYTVNGTGGCPNATASRTVTVNAIPTAAITPATATVCGGSPQTLTASGGTQYAWSNGGGNSASATFSPTTQTTYTVTVTNAANCSATASATISIGTATSISTQPVSQTACTGSNVTFNVVASGTNLSYVWKRGNNTVGTNSSSLVLNSVSASDAGKYTVEVTGDCGVVTSNIATLTIVSSASISQQPVNITTCSGTNQILTVVGTGGNNTVYQWKKGTQNVGTNSDTLKLNNITSNDAGTYSVVITGSCGTVTSNTVTVTVNANPTASIAPASVTICEGQSATLTASGGATYAWSNSGGNNASATFSPTTNTTYTVTVTNTANCSATASRLVNVTPLPTAAISPATVTICNGQSATLTASGGGTYAWSNGGGSNAAATFSPTTTTTYTVTVTQNGCSATASRIVTVNALPNAAVSPSSPSICSGASQTLTASGGTGYSWSNGLGSGATKTVSPTATTTYTVTVTNAANCSATASATVTVNTVNASINGPTTICSGLQATLTASGGTSYVWSNNATTAAITVSPTSTTTYTVTVTGAGNCTATASQTVSVQNAPTATISGANSVCAGNSVTLTANGGNTYTWSNNETTAAITVSPTATTTYTVTVSIGANCTATASQTVSVKQPSSSSISESICFGDSYTFKGQALTQSGTYKDTLTNAAGCDSIITLNLMVRNKVEETINAAICSGQSYTFKGQQLTQAGSYFDTLQTTLGCDSFITLNLTVNSFVTGSISQSICQGQSFTFNGQQLTQAGSYNDTLTSVGGCDSIVTLTLTVNSLPQPTITQNGNVLSTQTFNSYQWQLNNNGINNATNQSYTATQSGSYTVVVTDANGCSNTSSAVNVTISSVSEVVDFRSMIYPNPASTDLMIEASEQLEEVQISDVTGRIVFTQSKIFNLQSKIDVSALAEATYFIHIKTTNGKTAVKTFVKQ